MLREFENRNFAGIKVTDSWKEREIRLKMHLIEKKAVSYNNSEKLPQWPKTKLKLQYQHFLGNWVGKAWGRQVNFSGSGGIPPFFPPLEETLNQSHILKIDF